MKGDYWSSLEDDNLQALASVTLTLITVWVAVVMTTITLFALFFVCEEKMKKFRVMIVKKNGQPVGVRAAAINGRVIVLALHDEPEQMNWYDAVKIGVPTKEEWMAIAENLDAVNKALIRAGGEPLKNDLYWSSSECDNLDAWYSHLGASYGLLNYYKGNHNYVRPVLAL
nr:MAG TPA: Protein of unknown function (DUF1566) [Caudoviricetes sp.]